MLKNARNLASIFPEGATHDQLTKFGWFFHSGEHRLYRTYKYMPKALKRLDIETQAWSMMVSVHAYENVSRFFDTGYKYNYEKYLKAYSILGGDENTFMDSLAVQKRHLENTTVMHNVWTDSEDCSYNGLKEPLTKVETIELPA